VRIHLSFAKSFLVLISSFVLSACGLKPYISNSLLDKIGPTAVKKLQWVDSNLNAFTANYVAESSLIASWTPSDSPELARQEVQLYIGSQCNVKSGSPKVISSITQKSQTFTGLVDGTYSFKVLSFDPKGNLTASVCSNAMSIDLTAPVLTVSTGGVAWINNTNKTAFAVSGTCTDSGSGINADVTVNLSRGANNFLNVTTPCTGGTFSTNLNLTNPTSGTFSDGTNLSITATVADQVNNGTSATQAVSLDTVAPVIQITNAPTWINIANQSTYTVTGKCTESGSGISGDVSVAFVVNGDLLVSGSGACNAATSMFSATIDVSSLVDGIAHVTVQASASDVAGNTGSSAVLNLSKDTIAPVLTIVSPADQSFVKGNTIVPVSFTLTEINANNAQSISFAYNNGTSPTNSTVAVTNGPLTNASFSKSITTPNSSNTSISVTINYSDLAGNPASALTVNYKTDLGSPTVTSLSLNGVNSGVVNTDNNNVKVSLSATNQYSPVTQFCLKYNNTTTPIASDSCWVNVNAPLPNITPSTAITFSNYNYTVGFVKAIYTVYAWVKNEAGIISTLSSSGTGTTNIDKFAVSYDPGTPPEISKLEVTNTNTPASPITMNQLQAPKGTDIFVKWNASDLEGLATNPISIYYTLDNSTYIPFPGSFPNAPGAGCAIDGTFTGCARLTSPSDSFFRVRVVAKDTRDTTVNYNSEPLNSLKLRILAGNTETGVGGSAKTAIFKGLGQSSSHTYAFQNRLAVSSDGKYFYIDPVNGLVWINPANGILNVLVSTNGTSSTDNADGSSDVSSATLKSPLGIAMDYENHLLIYDFDRIRRVDLSTMKISTIIGGGTTDLSSSSAVVDNPLSVKLKMVDTLRSITMTMIPMPNGDLLFTSQDSNLSSLKDWKYVKTSKKLEPMLYTSANSEGMGNYPTYSWNTVGDNTVYKTGFAVEYDLSNSAVTAFIKGFYRRQTGDAFTHYTRINFNNGNALSGYPSTGPYDLGVLQAEGVTTGMDGKIYAVGRFRTLLRRYDVLNNNLQQKILGTGLAPSGACPENTPATSCAVDIESYFVSSLGRVYFMDQGFIRTINDAGEVITLFGQYPSYNGSGVVSVANARFGRIMDLKLDRSTGPNASNNNRVVILDSYSGTYREIVRNGNATPLTSADYQWHGPNKFELHPTTGDIFSPYGGAYIRRYSKSSNAWTNVVGGGESPYETTGDGQTGTNIKFIYYNVSLVGYIDNQLYYNKYYWSGTEAFNCMVKKYDTLSNYTQSHYLGNSTCYDEWAVGASTSSTGTSIANNVSRIEKFQGQNLILRGGETEVVENGEKVKKGSTMFTIDASGKLQKFALLNYPTYSFTTAGDSIYYCAGGYQIFKYTPSTNTTTELPLGPQGMVCSSQATLNYVSATNSIIFSFVENDMYGVAEYFL